MIDLQKFCCKPHDNRYNLEHPFSRGEWTYATNGHIAVRVPRVADSFDNKDSPAAETLSWPTAGMKFTAAPKIEIPRLKEWECQTCDGRGSKHDCPDCNCSCDVCFGTGQQIEKISVGVGPSVFNARYVSLALALPNLEFGPLHKIEPVPFRFDGGQGLLMPMRSTFTRHVQVDLAEAA